MKRTIIGALALVAAFACSRADITRPDSEPDTPQKGGGISCSLEIDNPTDDASRTVYGEFNGTHWPIYWDEDDCVKIFCEQTAPRYSDVTVPYTGAKQHEADLNDTGLSWTDAENYDFYAFYPARAVSDFSSSKVTATIPSIQSGENGHCDMELEFMAASAEGVAKDGDVYFKFKSLNTSVHIRLTASEEMEIQKLVLSSSSALAGKFVYDISEATCTPVEGSSSATLCMHMQTGQSPYLKLSAGQSVEFMAVLMPHDIEGLTLSVFTTSGLRYSRSTSATLKAGYRYTMTINDIDGGMQRSDAAMEWMTYLPDNAFLSQVSIPGSHDACAIYGSHYEYKSDIDGNAASGYHFKFLFGFGLTYTNTTKATKAQQLSIEEQLDAGVRMFDLRPCATNTYEKDLPIHHGVMELGDPSLGGYTSGKTGRQSLSPFTVSKVLDRFVAFLQKHPDETVLVHMKYENTTLEGTWRQRVVESIREHCDGYIADFRPDMTLSEARGKILFMIRVDYKDNNSGSYFGAYIDWGDHDKEVFQTALLGNDVGQGTIICNDLYNLSGGAYNGKTKEQAIDECIDFMKDGGDATHWAMNYVSCYDTKQCSITGVPSILGLLGDIDYCAAKYNKYAADKLLSPDFRGGTGIVLMDYAGADRTLMTYGKTYSDKEVYGDLLTDAVIANNNKWNIPCKE